MGKPNILFILADQLRKDSLGCYGNPYVQTPHIDSLALDGTLFERCYTANPLCMPSRFSIMSGMYPRNHGLWSNGVLADCDNLSIACHLANHGYETASIGKMHFQPTMDKEGKSAEARRYWNESPSHQVKPGYWGFQYIKTTIGHSIVTGNYREWFLEHGGDESMFHVNYTGPHTGGMDMPVSLHCSTYVGEMTKKFLKKDRDKSKPFFLTVSFPDPHFPFTPPKELMKERFVRMPVGDKDDLAGRAECYRQHYEGRWDRDGLKPPSTPEGLNPLLTKERIARTYEMTELMDDAIGTIVSSLQEEGIYEDTLIFFLSDHGELLGDHGLWFKGPFFYEGLINVPLIMVNHIQKKKRSNDLISLVDLVPTVCDSAKIQTQHYTDGISFADKSGKREHCLVEYRNGYGDLDFTVYALISKNDKLIRFDNGFYEFNDFLLDPQERQNFAGQESHLTLMEKRREELLTVLMKTSTNRFPQICPN